jgi:MFS family permease
MTEVRHTKILLGLLFTGVLMGALDLSVIAPALPAIEAEFGMQNRLLAVMLNAYVLTQMISTPLLAKMADRFGPRSIYIFSIAVFALGSLILVAAYSPYQLFLGRAVQGFGAGGIFPAAAAMIGARLPAKERGPALGLIGAVFGLAFLIGPVLGGIFLQYDWRWLFLINLPIGGLLIAGALVVMPGSDSSARKPIDFAGITTLSVTLAALVIAIGNLDTADFAGSLLSWPVGGTLLLVAALLPVFWHIEQRAADPVVRPGLFGSRQIVRTCVLAAGGGALQTAGAFYPALAIAALGVTTSTASWLLLPGVAAATVGAPLAGKLINRIGTRRVIVSCMVMVTISVLLYSQTTLTTPLFIAANVIGGAGMSGVLGAPLRYIMLNEARPSERGATQGLLSVFMSAGRLVGAALVGAVAASSGGGVSGYQAAFSGMAILAVALVCVALTLSSRQAEQRAGAPGQAAAPAST